MTIETKHYEDGTSATGAAPLPDQSPGGAPECHKECQFARTKEIMMCVYKAIDASKREDMYAYRDAAAAEIQSLETELTAESRARTKDLAELSEARIALSNAASDAARLDTIEKHQMVLDLDTWTENDQDVSGWWCNGANARTLREAIDRGIEIAKAGEAPK